MLLPLLQEALKPHQLERESHTPTSAHDTIETQLCKALSDILLEAKVGIYTAFGIHSLCNDYGKNIYNYLRSWDETSNQDPVSSKARR